VPRFTAYKMLTLDIGCKLIAVDVGVQRKRVVLSNGPN
jgi:hypothetical protein